MADIIITPASGLIDFQNVTGISSATIELDLDDILNISSAGGINLGDSSSDIIIGDGVNNVDIIFEQNGSIRGETGVTITLGQSGSFISFGGNITGNSVFAGRPAFNGGTSGSSSPFTVDSTQLVTNLNADLLDDQNGSYYLSYANFTGTPTIPSDTGDLTNGAGYITSSDNITGTASTATTVTISSNNDSTAYRVPYTSSTSGNVSLYVDNSDGMTYNPGTNTLFAGFFSGNGSNLTSVDADTLDTLNSTQFLRSDTASEITAPLTIDSDNNENGALRIENIVSNTNNDFYFAQEISQTLSGSQVATADREQGGIYMDINSTNTGGDTNNEHRAYGIFIDLDSTGDADAVYGIHANATATPTTGTASNVWAGYFFAEDNGGAGAVTNVYGVQAFAHSDNSTADTDNQYGGYFKAYCAADSAAVGVAYGVYSEIEINGTTDLYGPCYAFRAEIDNNTGVTQTNTSYLLYGNYSGDLPTTAYGVYINNNVPSYFGGGIEIPNGPGTIAGVTFANGWLRIGTSSAGITMDSNEFYFAGAGNIGALSGGSITFTTRPAFNGGTSGSSSPFTVDSTQVVTNLNADLLDGNQASAFLTTSDTTVVKTTGNQSIGGTKMVVQHLLLILLIVVDK
jgi:hypothetical protein